MATDCVGREIVAEDFVFHYNNLYQVKDVSKSGNKSSLRILIYPASKTSRLKTLIGRECCLIPKDDILLWMLKKGDK